MLHNWTVSDIVSGLLTPPTTPTHRALHGELLEAEETGQTDEGEGGITHLDNVADDTNCLDSKDNGKTMVDASVETCGEVQRLRRIRPVLHFKGPHPHPKVHLRSPTSAETCPQVEQAGIKFMAEPAYDTDHENTEAPLNTTAILDEYLHEVGTSTHEVISNDEIGEGYVVDHSDVVVAISQEENTAHLSSIHGSKDNSTRAQFPGL